MGRYMYSVIIFVLFCLLCTTTATPPLFSGLPTSVNVGEQEYENRLIYTLTVTDVNGDAYVCNSVSTTPSPARNETEFRVLIDPKTSKYGVYVHNSSPGTAASPNVMFDFNSQSTYTLTIRCTDSNGEYREDRLEIDIIPGDRLEFTHSLSVVSIDAITSTANQLVYTVSSRDLLNHSPLTYTLRAVPTSNSFSIDSSTGQIRTTKSLTDETQSPIDLYVTVTDGLIAVEKLLSIDITNLNSQPNITNLPSTVTVNEDIAGGTLIFTLTSSDLDAADTLTYTYTVSPITAQSLFSFDSATRQISLATTGAFDYETLSLYNISFTISDGKITNGPYLLYINIRNVNEACYFDRSAYYVNIAEGTTGSVSVNPNFVVKDRDGVQAYTLSFLNANNSQRFNIDSSTGVITFATDYDVDQNAMPSSVQLTVICSDPLAKTATTLLFITITDANDNSPQFSQGTYTFYADQYTGLGASLGQITVTDKDSSTNGEYSCGGSLASSAAQSNTFYTIGTNCGVYFLSRTGLSYGSVIRYLITATDKGSPALSSTTTVNLIYQESSTTTISTTTTVTTTPSSSLDDGSLAAIILGSLIGAVLLGVLLYFLIRWCYTGSCCGSAPCDFMECRQSKSWGSKRINTPPKSSFRNNTETADEMKYWRDDSDYGSSKNLRKEDQISWHGKREYPDFPQSVSQRDRLSPSNIPLEVGSRGYGRVYPVHRPLPITYY